MKKAIYLVLSILLFLVVFTACGGDTAGHSREITGNTLYSEGEINGLMDIAEKHFKGNFDGCKLISINYDEEFSQKRAEGWKKQFSAKSAAILTSSFYVGEKGGNGSLNPNSIYENWQWVFIKENGFWNLKTWGYG